jgi:hypothetical protein
MALKTDGANVGSVAPDLTLAGSSRINGCS